MADETTIPELMERVTRLRSDRDLLVAEFERLRYQRAVIRECVRRIAIEMHADTADSARHSATNL
jgi:hypothetical protein